MSRRVLQKLRAASVFLPLARAGLRLSFTSSSSEPRVQGPRYTSDDLRKGSQLCLAELAVLSYLRAPSTARPTVPLRAEKYSFTKAAIAPAAHHQPRTRLQGALSPDAREPSLKRRRARRAKEAARWPAETSEAVLGGRSRRALLLAHATTKTRPRPCGGCGILTA